MEETIAKDEEKPCYVEIIKIRKESTDDREHDENICNDEAK